MATPPRYHAADQLARLTHRMRVVGCLYPLPHRPEDGPFRNFYVPLAQHLPSPNGPADPPYAVIEAGPRWLPFLDQHADDLLHLSGTFYYDANGVPHVSPLAVDVRQSGTRRSYALTLSTGETFVAPPRPTDFPYPLKPPRWTRLAAAAWLMIARGVSTSWDLRQALGVHAGPRTYDMLINPLVSSGLAAHIASVPLSNASRPFSSITILQPTDLAYRLAQLYRWPSRETDWQKLQRLHGGNGELKHNAAVLALAFHLRRYGFPYVAVLPTTYDTAFAPDVAYGSDDYLPVYIELEIPARAVDENYRIAKWRNQNTYQGCIALCTITPGQRGRLATALRKAGYTVAATDLATLAHQATDPTVPFWIDGEPLRRPVPDWNETVS